jgi:hypothetical protein
MRTSMITTVCALLAAVLLAWGTAAAEVKHIQLNPRNLFVKVSDDPWQPEGFENGTEVPATYLADEHIVLDGIDDEPAWLQAREVRVPLSHGQVQDASLKALYTDEEVFIRVRWADDSESREHRPWVWGAEQGRFVEGPQVEDSVLLSFEAGCEWNPSLLAGYVFDFDGWQWLAARSDPLGQAVDLMGHVQDQSFGINEEHTLEYPSRYTEDTWNMKFTENEDADLHASWDQNRRVYLLQPINRLVYITARPDPEGRDVPAFVEQVPPPRAVDDGKSLSVPQFSPVRLRDGAGEVSAKGAWKDGYWTVEFRRALETAAGFRNDTVFQRITQFSVHVFAQTERVDESSESGRLFLRFLPPDLQAAQDQAGTGP